MDEFEQLLLGAANTGIENPNDSIKSFEDLLNEASQPAKAPSVTMDDKGNPSVNEAEGLSEQDNADIATRADQFKQKAGEEEQATREFSELPWYQQINKPMQGGFKGMAGDAKTAAAELMRDGNYIDYLTSMATGQLAEELLGPTMDIVTKEIAKKFGKDLDDEAMNAIRMIRNPIHYGLKNTVVKTLKDNSEEFNESAYNKLTENAQLNYDNSEELNRGAHGILADIGGAIPNTAELAGVIVGSTLVPAAAPGLSAAYLGKMGFTTYGAGLREFDEYKKSIGEDPLDEKNSYTRQWVGLGTAASEVGAEALLGGITRFMPNGLKTGAGQILARKLTGSKAGVDVTERALRNFATDNPKIWEKLVTYGGKQVDQAWSETKEEGITQIAQTALQYIYKEAEDHPDLNEYITGLGESTKGAVLMTLMLGPVTSGSSSIQRRQRRNQDGLNIGMDKAGNVFEIVGSKDGLIAGETRLGYSVSVKQEDMIEQAYITNDEYNAYLEGAKKGMDQAVLETASMYRNNQTGNIETISTINQEDDDTPMILIELNDKDAVVVDFSEDENGKRRIIPKDQIHKQSSIPFDEYYQGLREQYESVAANQIDVELEQSANMPEKPQIKAGDLVEFGGVLGVVSIEPDGTIIIDGESGSTPVTKEEIANIRPATIIPVNGEELPAIETENGLEVQKEFMTPEEAAAVATVLDGLYQGKRTFRVEPMNQEDPNKPNTYQLIGGEYKEQQAAVIPNEQLPPPPSDLVNDGDGNITPLSAPIEQAQPAINTEQQAQTAAPTYKMGGKEVSRGFLKAKIKGAKSRADLEGVELSNDPELEQALLSKFPEGVYSFDGDPLTREEAMDLIESSSDITDLEGIKIDNDPEMESIVMKKFPKEFIKEVADPIQPEVQQPTPIKPEPEAAKSEIPVLKHNVKTKTWRDNPSSRRYQSVNAEPVSLKHLIIQAILGRGINTEFFRKEWSKSNAELRQRISLLAKDGIDAFDKLQESLEGAHPDLFSGIDFQAFNTMVEETVWSFPSVGKLMDEADRIKATSVVSDQDGLSSYERRYIEERQAQEDAELDQYKQYYDREIDLNEFNTYLASKEEYFKILADEFNTEANTNTGIIGGDKGIYESDVQEVHTRSRGTSGPNDVLQGQSLATDGGQDNRIGQGNGEVSGRDVRAYGTTNKVVSNVRYDEIKKKLKEKYSNLNAGFDPEMFAMGAEMAAFHIEAGTRRFADFAKQMIDDLGEWVKPYLKSFYNGARDFPGMEGYADELDGYDAVKSYDLDKVTSPDAKPSLTENQQADLDKQLAEIDRSLETQRAEYDNAIKNKNKKSAEFNSRNSLFGDTTAGPTDLFAGQFLMNKETMAKAMKPFNDRVEKAKDEIARLEKLRQGVIDNADKQGDLYAQDLDGKEKGNNLDKNKTDVSNRPGDSKQDRGERTDEVQPDETTVSSQRRGSGQDGTGTTSADSQGNAERGSSQRFSDKRGPLFGEGSNREISPEASIDNTGITGDFNGRGSSIDSTTGSDVDGGRSDGKTEGGSNNNGESFKERTKRVIEAQKAVEDVPVILMDEANIRETLPLLLQEQQDDVIKAESRFFGEKTADSKKWANGKGMLFTNGTGTGKTFTGLGIIKRMMKNGAKRVLIVCPASKTTDWKNDASKINLNGRVLANTKDSGDGLIITSIENFRMNQELLKEAFDLVVYDESHKLMEDKDGKSSLTSDTHYMMSNRNEFDAARRIKVNHPVFVEYRELRERNQELSKTEKNSLNPEATKKALADSETRLNELKEQMRELDPIIQEQAKQDVERTKVVFLSATPFKTIFNLRYAQGILFDWGRETTYTQASRGMSRVDAESQFYLDNFGSQFEWKFHRLQTKPDRNDEAVAMQEVEFAERLMDAGVLSGRTIESNMDYSREFPVVASDETFHSSEFNKAYSDIYDYDTNAYQNLRGAAHEVFMSHHEATLLFEVLTTSMSLDRMEAHLAMGRKIAVYHRRQNGTSAPPFAKMLQMANDSAIGILQDESSTKDQKDKAEETLKQVDAFRRANKSVLEFEQTLDYRPAPVQVKERFGDWVVVFTEASKKDRAKQIERFNTDGSGIDIIVVQEQSGKEGISLHDTTGKHPRVVMQMSKPNSSIAALQIEGRIYRIGQESNAMFEYPVLGLDMELAYYGSNLNKRLSTTENLAMGNQSRDLIRSFSEGILYNANSNPPSNNQGSGGKEFDQRAKVTHTPFQRARLVYATNQKARGKRDSREGIDFYATPEPVGQKMVEWADVRPGDNMLEPSAGMGSIAMWMPKHGSLTAVEPSYNLFAKLSARTGDLKKKIVNDTFENLHAVNKFESIVMNPPFGSGGKLAMEHLEKAFMHLKENGRIVALIPRGKMDERLEKFLYGEDEKGRPLNPNAHLVASINLPASTFGQAGTSVSTRIVIIDKVRPDREGLPQNREIDLSDAKDINDLFDGIESVSFDKRMESEGQAVIEQAPKEFAGQVIDELNKPLVSYLEQKHSKTGATRHTVPISVRVERETYASLNSLAKSLGGYYNSWNKQGSTAGFEFKTKEEADSFIEKANNMGSEDNQADEGIRFKRKDNFYSPTERALTKIKQDKGTPDQFKAMLLKNGAKEVELNWMVWDERFPDNKKTITKAEIQDWIDENKVELNEVVKIGATKIDPNNLPKDWSYSKFADGVNIYDENGNVVGEGNSLEEAAKNVKGDTTYNGYVLMGGANYREVLLTMPAEKKDLYMAISKMGRKANGSTYEYFEVVRIDDPSQKASNEIFDTIDKANQKAKTLNANSANQLYDNKNVFKSSHWDEPNIAVHTRLQDFVDTQGRKVLLIEEIQSDWAQKGKKEGFIAGIPDMPFKQTPQWTGLALKRILQYASEGGYDMIAWTTGETQAGRYDLSKSVNKVVVQKQKDGQYRVAAWKDSPTAVHDEIVPENKIENIVGKEIANKAINDGQTEFKGDDLRVGGEGMKAFYDNILPSVAKKTYGKQAVIGTTEIITPTFETGGNLVDKTTTVHSIELTNDLKDAGKEEQAMFKKDVEKAGKITADEFFTIKEKVKKSFDNFKAISRKAKEAAAKFKIPIVTVRKTDGLPEHIRKKMNPEDKAQIQGVYDSVSGMVYLVSDNLRPSEADKVILHEVLAHKGLREVLGKKYNPILKSVYDSMAEADKKAIGNLYDIDNPYIIADEYIAELAENYKRPGLLNRTIAKIRNLLREVFGINYSKADIMYMLSKSEDYYIMKPEPNKADFSNAQEYLESFKEWDSDNGIRKRKVLQVDTKQFNDWFGNSKIVDSNGRPLIYFHATGSDFDAFTPNARGLLFASPDAKWAQDGFMPLDKEAGTSGSVMPVYVKTENPFDYRNAEQLDSLLNSMDVRESIKEHIRNGSPWGLEKPAVIQAIKDAGYDGFYVTEEGVTNIGVFEPTQMKSATGNSGGFDPNNPDVRFKKTDSTEKEPADLRQKGDKAREKIQDRMITVKRVQQEVAKRAGLDKLPWWMDTYNQENRSHGRVLAETERVNKHVIDPLIKAVFDVALSDKKEDLEALQRYLKAKHAPERNRVISKRKELETVENQSGFTDDEANAIVEAYESTREAKDIDRLWEKVRALTNYTLDRWLKDGFISKEQHEALTTGDDAYSFYVPLRGHKDVGESVFEYQNGETGKHINPYKAAKGRESESEDPIQYMANMAQTAIVMGENNKIKQYAYRMVSNHENTDLYHIKKAYYVATGTKNEDGTERFIVVYERPPQQLWDEGKVQVKFNNRRMAIEKKQAQEHEVEVMIGGEKVLIRFENPEVANAINKNNVATFTGNNWLEGLARFGGHTTRLLTANFTAKNPGFIIPNTVRDVSYAWISHAIKGEGGDALKFIGHLRTANQAMTDYNKWEKAKTEYENAKLKVVRDGAKTSMDKYDTKNKQYLDSFLENGAATGYIHLKDIDTLGKEIEKELKRHTRSVSGNGYIFNEEGYYRVWHKSGKILEALAQRSENMSRLATFILAIENGKSAADAASEAKNITVNFNRKGSQSNVLGSFYAFLNASIQGGENIARIAKEHPKKFVMGASMIYSFGFLTALLSHMNDDDEEDNANKYKNINDYTKQNHFTIRYGTDKYISIPLPHGWRSFYGLGISTFENIFLDKEKKAKFNWAREDRAWDKLAYDFADRMIDATSSVNPIDAIQGGEVTLASVSRVIAPTGLTPFVDIASNRDFSGREIHQVPYTKQHEEFNADAGQFRKNVNFIVKGMTDKLYVMGGGDLDTYTRKVLDNGELKDVNLFLDYNPSNIEHLITYYTGGRGSFFNDMFKTTVSVVEGMSNAAKDHPDPFENFESNNVPVINRFNRNAYDYDDYKWYYGVKDEIKAYQYNRSKLGIERKIENINPRIEMLDDITKDTDKQLKELKELKNEPGIIADPRKVVEIRKTEKRILKELRKALEQYTQ